MIHRLSRGKLAIRVLGAGGLVLLHGWALLALYFWFVSQPAIALVVAVGYLGLLGLIFRLARSKPHAGWTSLVLFLAVVVWWTGRKAEPGLKYPRETEQAARLEKEGDSLTVHAMRDFRYRSPTDYDARWSSRTFDLDQLEAVDLFFNNWGIPDIDHVITSFAFKDQPPLAVSIELRAEADEPNTLLRGFFKQYELFYVWADERDLINLRTTARGEEVRLFRTSLTPETGRQLLLEMAARSNLLEDHPEFYNTLTDNCTNVIARHVDRLLGREVPWYRRPLRTGTYVRLGYDQGWLIHSQPWEEFRAASLINDRARSAAGAPDFSSRIRSHLPAFQASAEQYPSQ